jgi:tetratricopeptide (TPR) repeat protein
LLVGFLVGGFLPCHAVRAADLFEATNLYRTGKYAECVDAAAAGIAESEFNESWRLLKLQAQMQLGRYPDALKSLDEALEKVSYSIRIRWIGREVCRFNGELERAKKLDEETTELLEQFAWRYSDAANQVVIGQFLLDQGMDAKQVLTKHYNEAKRRQPNNVDVLLAIGELALSKHDYLMAGDAYQQAVKLDDTNADALFGVARSFGPSDSEKAEAALQAALAANPHHIAGLLFIVDNHVDAERYDDADKVLAQVASINPHEPRALAYRAALAHLRNDPEKEQAHRQAALRHWPQNPEVDYLIGKKLSQKYRFAEGAQYQRQALEFDPNYILAKSQLAQDLLRLGKVEEGLRLAEAVYDQDAYNIFAHNLVTLQENLAKFRTLEEDNIFVRMEAREAEIYGHRVLDLLKRAKAVLCEKYDVELKEPIIVEIFPRQQDFAIRTFGLPGGQGFLGVCFGTVITANSPASQGTSPACWEATLWHEFCHVVTLNKTNNKMPRWLSEGISVYEERQANPTWGQRMNPQYREMILGDDLTPVSELSGAFLRPTSPLHLQFAYYESSLVVEYFIEKYGLETLQRVLTDLAVGMPINESLNRYTGSIAALDKEFADYAREKAKNLAQGVDWATPELPRRATLEMITEWVKEHPNNYEGLRRLAQQQMADKAWEAAIETLEKMRKLYPQDAGAANPRQLLAEIYAVLEQNQQERVVLEELADLSDDNVTILSRLCKLTSDAQDWAKTKDYALRWLAVNPLVPDPHRYAAQAAEHLEDHALAVESYQALLAQNPFDLADAHYRLATALRRTGENDQAKRHVLFALEQTPRFREAQRLLLEIVDEKTGDQPATSEDPPVSSEIPE